MPRIDELPTAEGLSTADAIPLSQAGNVTRKLHIGDLIAVVGERAPAGPQGDPGPTGGSGLSAYEVAVADGFIGSEAEWLESLQGQDGAPGEPGSVLIPGNVYTSGHVLTLDDVDGVRMDTIGLAAVNIPLNSLVPFPIGSVVPIEQYGAGQTLVVPAVGVTLRSVDALTALRAQYSVASLRKTGTDEWLLEGDLAEGDWSPTLEPILGQMHLASDLSDGPVSSWLSQGNTEPMVQATSGSQPNKTGGYVVFDGVDDKMTSTTRTPTFVKETPVPDAQGSSFGHGFSNNGLVRAPDGTFWLSNGGLAREDVDNSLRRQSLVHLSADLTTKLHEIDLYTLADGAGTGPGGGNGSAPRGIAYDTSDDTLWTIWGARTIHVGDILTGGTILSDYIDVGGSSVSYSPSDDSLYIMANGSGTIKRFRCSDGVETFSMASNEVYQDHMCWDPITEMLYIFCGDNDGPSSVIVKDPLNGRTMGSAVLPGFSPLGAVEQGCVSGTKLYVNSNAYFHKVPGGVNRVLEFDMPPRYASPVVHFWYVGKIPSVGGSSDFIGGSDQADKYSGFGLLQTSVTSLRPAMHTGANDTTVQRTLGSITVPTTVNDCIIYAEYAVGDAIRLYSNGVLRGTLPDTNCVGQIRAPILRLSAARDPNAENRQQTKVAGVYLGAGPREKTEGWLEYICGLDVLPADHPYKDWAATGSDADVVLIDEAQTLTNKTISGAANSLTVRLDEDVVGVLPIDNLDLPGGSTVFLRGDGVFAVPAGGGGGSGVAEISYATFSGYAAASHGDEMYWVTDVGLFYSDGTVWHFIQHARVTWANRGTPKFVGQRIFITDFGIRGAVLIAVGTSTNLDWRLTEDIVYHSDFTTATTTLGTGQQKLKETPAIPAGMLAIIGAFTVEMGATKSGTTDTCNPRVYIGPNGSTADQDAFALSGGIQTTHRTWGLAPTFVFPTTTSIKTVGRADGPSLVAGATATELATSVADLTTTDHIISSIFQMSGSSNTLTQTRFRVIMHP